MVGPMAVLLALMMADRSGWLDSRLAVTKEFPLGCQQVGSRGVDSAAPSADGSVATTAARLVVELAVKTVAQRESQSDS